MKEMNSPSEQPNTLVTDSDIDLLQKFEPVACYTKGEVFFPVAVKEYIQECSLWAHRVDGDDELLIKQNDLSLEKLVKLPPAPFGTVHFLRFIETLNLTETAQVLSERLRIHFNKPDQFIADIGRLARGGFLPRVADALFSLTLLLRGRVPTAIAAAAELAYLDMDNIRGLTKNSPEKEPSPFLYYGRVHRSTSGWIVLQYWFFYCYNNWRSGYQGVNDHEADWENINIYLYPEGDRWIPEWVAYASHDYYGDDLRRRWDDRRELTLWEGHPVIYVGAGSHASYFRKGEYQSEVNLRIPRWIKLIVNGWRTFWTEFLGQEIGDPFRIPFVDYARGDGLVIGPGQARTWTRELIDHDTPWVSQYRGLWGLYARDPISGENAPAGPMYNRDGTPRVAWYDPLGLAGLDKVAPPPQALKLLEEECKKIKGRAQELDLKINQDSEELQALGSRLEGMQGSPHLAKQYAALSLKAESLSRQLRNQRREYSEDAILLESLTQRCRNLAEGIREDAQAHINHRIEPVIISKARFDRAIETWAPISLGLLLVGAAGFLLFTPGYFWGGMLVLVIIFMLIEAALRGSFSQSLSRITTLLSLFCVVLLLFHFWKEVIALGLIGIAAFLLTQRIRDLRWRNVMRSRKKSN